MNFSIPKEVKQVSHTLKTAGFEAYLVGGCVRDLCVGRTPRDWDLTTNARPEEIQALFLHSFYENSFGTVGVVNDETEDITLKVIEVTPYRIESIYSDFRRPDAVTFSDKLEDDLKRRDFTINALALDLQENDKPTRKGHIIDLYNGLKDIEAKVIRTVGHPGERFTEDALRMLRAIRIGTELSFMISHETSEAIMLHLKLLENISKERIRDEFIKIIMSDNPMQGVILCEKLGVLTYIAPELLDSIGIEQNKKAHKYTVWEHLLRSLQHAADKKWSLEVRLAALFHDISKPETRRFTRNNGEDTCSFYGHEVLGARKTRKILERLRFPVKLINKVERLIRWHMFFADTEQITLSAVRRLIHNVGPENVWDLMNLRACDRIGTGRPKESPYRLRKYHAMIEEAMMDPISVGLLKIDGKRIMEVTHETPGKRIGYILHALLEEAIEDSTKNNTEYLEKRAIELSKLDEKELEELGKKGKELKEEEEQKQIEEIRGKHGVK